MGSMTMIWDCFFIVIKPFLELSCFSDFKGGSLPTAAFNDFLNSASTPSISEAEMQEVNNS